MTDTQDAIERAQAWLAHAAECTVAADEGFPGPCETDAKLARLGSASVGLAVAAGKLMDALRAESDKDRILAEAEINGALVAWEKAVQEDGQ